MNCSGRNTIVIAANNGDVGGGEIMLLALAEELGALGFAVTIVGPAQPSRLVEAARSRALSTVVLEATNRFEYLQALRAWDRRHRKGVLWCNGLLPAVATAGRAKRIVHLHQRPRGKQGILARIARWGSIITLVPSVDMAADIRGSVVLHNWVKGVWYEQSSSPRHDFQGPIRLGFLGRPSTDKGVHILAEAVRFLNQESPGRYRLVLAGESRFVDGASRAAVEAALATLGSLVTRAGWIPPEDLYNQIDILVCPSVWAEPFGLVVAEAMSARVPVVVSNAGALPEVVGPKHPWVATAGDARGLADVIRQAALGDPAVVERAYQRWRSMFSPNEGRQRLSALLGSLGYPAVPEEKVGP